MTEEDLKRATEYIGRGVVELTNKMYDQAFRLYKKNLELARKATDEQEKTRYLTAVRNMVDYMDKIRPLPIEIKEDLARFGIKI